MKALTLWEPWAWLIAYEQKRVETRCWTTSYRGPIAIHSALRKPSFLGKSALTPAFQEQFMRARQKVFGSSRMPEFHFGHVLCVADLVSIEPTERVRTELSPQELMFGNYEDGHYAWFFENVRRYEPTIPAKGNRMLWEWAGSGAAGAQTFGTRNAREMATVRSAHANVERIQRSLGKLVYSPKSELIGIRYDGDPSQILHIGLRGWKIPNGASEARPRKDWAERKRSAKEPKRPG